MTFEKIQDYLICPFKATFIKREVKVLPYPPELEVLLHTTIFKEPHFIKVTKRKPDLEKLTPMFRLKLEWYSYTLHYTEIYAYYVILSKKPYIIEHLFRLPINNLNIEKIIEMVEHNKDYKVPHGLGSPFACNICEYTLDCEYNL